MEEKRMTVDRKMAKDYIAEERKSSIFTGLGYMCLVLGTGVYNLLLFGKNSAIIGGGIVVLGVILILFVSGREKKEYKKIREEGTLLEEGLYKDIKRKYQEAGKIYVLVYALSIVAMVSIVGRSLFIVFYYKACPKNDFLIYMTGSVALFCYVYASGLMGAYRNLLRRK